jgi:hypothetical protein
MSEPIPDRTGWLDGYADKAPSLPLVELTAFEREALRLIAPQFGAQEADFQRQVAHARVTDRVHTVVGFYTRVEVDRSACAPVAFEQQGGAFEVPGVEAGLGVVLWGSAGYLETIEGYSYGDADLESLELRDLRCGAMTWRP